MAEADERTRRTAREIPRPGMAARLWVLREDGLPTWSETVDILDCDGNVVADDGEVRDHPEVPLTEGRRDAVLRQLGYERTGPWVESEGGDESATAPVRPVG